MKKKIKYNPRIVKKTILWVILALLVFWLGASIVISYGSGRITSNSSLLDREAEGLNIAAIPNGDYRDYLKIQSNANAASDPSMYTIEWENLNLPTQTKIAIPLETVEISDDADEVNANYTDKTTGKTGVLCGEDGTLTWSFDITNYGLYYIQMSYVLPKKEVGSGSNAERKFYINGNVPFDGLGSVTFYRLWKDAEEIKQDINGNDLKPSQVEVCQEITDYVRDTSGYITDPYLIYFRRGTNTISIESLRETLLITEISLVSYDYAEVNSYEAYLQQHKDAKEVTGFIQKYEGEASNLRSSPTLYGISDRTSPANYPSDPVKTKYNAIGGSKWSSPGDWIAWDVEVPEDGLYYLTFRAKQDLSRGMFSTRRLYINGTVPFDEANSVRFFYNSDYRNVTIGGEEDGEYYLFYLNKGVNQIRLEATLGDYGSAISDVQTVIDDLNELYLKIIAITTPNPDENQTYNLYGEGARIENDSHGRNMQKIFSDSAVTLNNVSKYIAELTGEKSSLNNTLDKMVIQIGGIVDGRNVGGFATNPSNVTKDLSSFKTNLSSLGTWILEIRDQSLTIESFYVHSTDVDLPRANADWFSSTWFGISGFFQSFFFDYESIGVTSATGFEKEIEVWYLTNLSSGREQANAIKSLVDSTFIQQTGINVVLKVLSPDVLLPATLAGTGPDVAINVDGGLPVNYALRGAVYDVSQQSDFYQVTGICSAANQEAGECVAQPENYQTQRQFDYPEYARFQYSSMVPLELAGGYYGLPNTATFLVLFYRTDIFANNKWSVPRTWDDVKALITELQVSNLEFYMPLEGAGSTIYATMLYQRPGGRFYEEDETKSWFSNEVALQTFEDWSSWFTDYSLSKSASFVNRFRSGEMPIGISSYDLFNTLTVFAPDIAGKWAFAPLPGTETLITNESGQSEVYYSNSGTVSTTASIIMKNAKDVDSSWEFLKWWSSESTQTSYARELESILGAAARHTTANVNAFESLAWTKTERQILMSQWDISIGIPEIAGGYYVSRNLENALRAVIDNDVNARETFEEYIDLIDGEITRKRLEFADMLNGA